MGSQIFFSAMVHFNNHVYICDTFSCKYQNVNRTKTNNQSHVDAGTVQYLHVTSLRELRGESTARIQEPYASSASSKCELEIMPFSDRQCQGTCTID